MGSGALFGLQAQLVIAPTSGALGADVSALKIAWEAKKTSSSSANTATIKVWNMAAATRNKIVAKKTALQLKAGYGEASDDSLPVLATGVVLRVEHTKPDVDVETEIQIRDGGLGLDGSQFRKAYPARTLVQSVVDDILAAMPDVSRGPMLAAALGQQLTSKIVFSGQARTAMDKLATRYGFEWSIQDGAAQVLDRTGAREPQISATLLSPDTGLVGSPARTNAGCKATALLMPHILPGSFIEVRSELVSGYFKALTVEHTGDSFGGEGRTVVDTKSIDKWVGPGAKKAKGKK